MLRNLLIPLLAFLPVVATANEYRGMPAGWPISSGGVPAVPVTSGYAPAGYQLYQTNRPSYAAPAAYYAARPVQAVSAAYAPTPGMAPSYSTVNYTQPMTAYYAPQGGYAATPAITAYSPGVAAGMSPAYGISPQPGTMLQPQRVYYGTAGSMSFAAPAAPTMYRAYYAPAAPGAVTLYRPVTVYQPATGQPVTCLQAVTAAPAYQTCGTAPAACGPAGCGTTTCGSSGCSWNLFRWLCPRGCGTSGCGTTGCAPTGCGQQPYYPVVPVTPVTPTIPIVPAPVTTTPPVIGTPRVPPPPTRILGPTTPADTAPSLSPGSLPSTGSTIVTPPTTITPAPTTPITPSPTYPAPSSSPYAPGNPGTALPATEYYPPSPENSRFDGSRFVPQDNGSNSSGTSNGGSSTNSNNTLRFSPPAATPPNGVKIVPDPDAPTFKPTNRAPQLIDPRDRSAALHNPWAVVPAVWPTKQRIVASPAQPTRQPSEVGGRLIHVTNTSNASRQLNERTDFTPTSAFVPQAEESLDDSGWTTGR